MTKLSWSYIQDKRLKELDASAEEVNMQFDSPKLRDSGFQIVEKKLIKQARYHLNHFRENVKIPALCRLERNLVDKLSEAGFVQVTTPTMMSRGLLAKMTIDSKHPLYSQVFWVNNEKCLRPMLAPHLYYVLKDLLRLWEPPVRIFEIGSCFRKESQGARHASEFTMLNLVEMGLPEEERLPRLRQLAALVAETTGLTDYRLETESSTVYGETIDVVAGPEKIEVGSAAMGPHQLDHAWRIRETWVGIGFGLERLMMVKENSTNLAKMGRSLSYLNGIRLNV